jgi:hypothetical protein
MLLSSYQILFLSPSDGYPGVTVLRITGHDWQIQPVRAGSGYVKIGKYLKQNVKYTVQIPVHPCTGIAVSQNEQA